MPLSPCATAGLTVSSTFVASPALNAAAVTLVALSRPPTLNADLSGNESVTSTESKVRVSVSPSAEAPSRLGGVRLAAVVVAASDAVHRPVPSAFFARTCTRWAVPGARPTMSASVSVPTWSWPPSSPASTHSDSVAGSAFPANQRTS